MFYLQELKAAIMNIFLTVCTRLAVFKIIPSRPMFSLGYGHYGYYPAYLNYLTR